MPTFFVGGYATALPRGEPPLKSRPNEPATAPLPTFCGSMFAVGVDALGGSFAPGFINSAKLPFGSETAPRLMTGGLGEVARLRCPALPG